MADHSDHRARAYDGGLATDPPGHDQPQILVSGAARSALAWIYPCFIGALMKSDKSNSSSTYRIYNIITLLIIINCNSAISYM